MAPVILADVEHEQLLEKIMGFEKYAHLLMERFDVKIVFDGANAYTDGQEIHLPNLLTLTVKEIDLLYGILLHEVGHVKYTEFGPGMDKYYAKCETYNMVMLSNAIEDARIENKLMVEFGGARKILEDLYGIFTEDKKYMERIFKFKSKTSDWFHDFGRCIHGHIVDLDFDRAKSIGKNYKKVDALYTKIEHLVNTMPLKSHRDSFELAFAIYDHIFKQTADKSEKTDYAARQKAKEESEKLIQKYLDDYNAMVEKNRALMEKLKNLRSEKRNLSKGKKQFKAEHKKDITQAEKEMMQSLELENKLLSPEYAKAQEEHAKAEQEEAQRELDELQAKMDAKAAKQEDYLSRQENATEKQKEKLQKSIEAQERMKKALEKKLEDAKNATQEAEKDVKRAQDRQAKAEEEAKKVQLTKEQIEKMYKDAAEKVEGIQQQEHQQFGEKMDKLAEKIRQENYKYQQERAEMEQKLGSQMKGLDEQLKKMGMDMGVVPEFKENPDWKESDDIQKSFDDKATKEMGQPVTNGCGAYGTNLRDIVATMEDISGKLNDINIAEIFDKESHESLVDSINETDSQQTNTRASEKAETYTSTRKHIPYTTRFDVVVEKTSGGNASEVSKIKSDHAKDIAKLTQVLRAKFKFKSKPKFKGGQEEGYLDPRELWNIPKGTSTHLFEQIEKRIDSKVQVAIALDVSGSMDKEEMGYGEKVKALAVCLSEALTNAKVKHEVLGYSAPVNFDMQVAKANTKLYNRTMHNLETVVYKSMTGVSALQNIELQTNDNSDGESLRVIAKRLMKAGSKKKVIFVVSDNKPFLTDADTETLDQDLRNAITECRSKGIEVYGIGWNNTGEDFYGDKYCNMEHNIDSLVKFFNNKLIPVT